jgi:hypothetical protein
MNSYSTQIFERIENKRLNFVDPNEENEFQMSTFNINLI